MPKVFIREKNATVNFPDGTAPDVMEQSIRDTFFSPEEQAKMTTFKEREGYRLRKGQATVNVGMAYWNAMEGHTTDDIAKKFDDDANKEFTLENNERFAAQNIGEKFVGATTELAPYMFSSTISGVDYGNRFGAAAAAAALVAGQTGPQVLLPEEIITVPVAFVSGRMIGQAYGAWQNAARVEGGNIYGTLLKEGVDKDTARNWAVPAGIVIGAIELFQISHLFNRFPGGFRLGRRAITDLIVKATKKKVVSTPLRKFVATAAKFTIKMGTTTALEIIEEDVQEVVTLAAEAGAHLQKAIEQDTDFEGPTFEDAKNRIRETTIQGLLGFPLLGLPGSVVSTIGGRSKDKATTQKGQDALKEQLAPLVEEAQKFDNVDDFIKENDVTITEEIVQDLGFDNKELLMEATFEESQRIKAEELAIEKKALEAKVKAEKLAKVSPEAITEEMVRESIKDVQIKGRLTKLDTDLTNIRKQIDTLEAQRKTALEAGKRTKSIENKIDVLQKEADIIDSEIAELLTTEKEKIVLTKEKIELTAEQLVQREKVSAKKRVQAFSQGVRLGTISTKEQIKQTQTELTEIITKSGMDAEDKAKFIKTIKNIQTKEDLTRVDRKTKMTVLQEIEQRIEKLIQSAEKDRLGKQIKKELKTTKPVKVGLKRVGKYNYENNKLFEELRSYNKLTKVQAQAKLDAYSDEANTEIDLIKKRFLSLKANGKSASSEIYSKVLEDIRTMKYEGEQSKSEADFEKALQRQEIVDSTLDSMKRIRADKKTIKTKIINVYRQGFSNIYSMMNSLFGKKFAEQYDPEIFENERDTAVFFKTKRVVEGISTIYGERNAFKVLETLAAKDYRITDIDGLTTELSKLELIDIYNSLKNDLGRARYDNAFGEAHIKTLLGNLDKKDTAFGDLLQETVQEYRPIYNERNIEITGRDMGFVESYWPFTSEFQVDVLDDIRIQGETPKALKGRVKSAKVIPVPKNAWSKTQKHIAQGEHLNNLSRRYETLKRLFSDRKVKHAIKEKFGDNVYNVLMDQVENLSLNAQTKKIDAVSKWFGFAINNWVTAKIGLNPSTYIRQLMSVGNYIEHMNPNKWVEGFFEGVSSPKKTFNFMWENAPFLEARFNRGYSEALKSAIAGAERLSGNWSSYTKFLLSLAKSGDITAIIYGGFPLVKSELAKGKSMKEAMKTFEKATLKSQQSGLSSSISQFQNSRNPFARLFLAFKNTSNQYLRKMADAVISRVNGDISVQQFAKTMLIYAIIQPILYASSGFLLREFFKGLGNLIFGRKGEDPEEIKKKFFLAIITQIAVAGVNAIPVIDDIATFAVRKMTGQKVWKVFSTPLFDDLETGLRKLGKKEITAEDYLIASASILEPLTAGPIKTFLRIFEYVRGKKKKTTGVPAI